MIRINTIIFFLIISVSASGNNVRSSAYLFGSIITKTDTIKCYIEHSNSYNEIVRYKMNLEDKKSLKIDASLIQKIKISTTVYERISYGNGKSALMKILLSGEISLYKYTVSSSSSYVYAPGTYYGGRSTETEKLFLVNKGSVVKAKKRKIRETLKKLMVYNEEIQVEIEQFKPSGFQFESSLRTLLSKYNFWYKYEMNNQ